MLTDLRRSADAEAQRAMRALVKHTTNNPDHRDPLIEDAYFAAERVVDAVIELEHAAEALAQRDDPESPDYFAAWTENELRAAWGDR
jgi:hypothetical protein